MENNPTLTVDALNRLRGGVRRGSGRMCTGHTGNTQETVNIQEMRLILGGTAPQSLLLTEYQQPLGPLQSRASAYVFTFLVGAASVTGLRLCVSFQRQCRQVIYL